MQKERRRKELERDEEQKKARKRKEELEVRHDSTSLQWDVTPTHCRRKKGERRLNVRRKRGRLRISRKSSTYVLIPTSSNGMLL